MFFLEFVMYFLATVQLPYVISQVCHVHDTYFFLGFVMYLLPTIQLPNVLSRVCHVLANNSSDNYHLASGLFIQFENQNVQFFSFINLKGI